jgi:sec-independent protein translocase protein TatB
VFDVGFWEIIIILVIALLVVGPQRLPRLARTAGLWLGKARNMVASVKADIDRELAADELKRHLAKQAELSGVHEIIEETKGAARDAAGTDETAVAEESKPDYLVKAVPDEPRDEGAQAEGSSPQRESSDKSS